MGSLRRSITNAGRDRGLSSLVHLNESLTGHSSTVLNISVSGVLDRKSRLKLSMRSRRNRGVHFHEHNLILSLLLGLDLGLTLLLNLLLLSLLLRLLNGGLGLLLNEGLGVGSDGLVLDRSNLAVNSSGLLHGGESLAAVVNSVLGVESSALRTAVEVRINVDNIRVGTVDTSADENRLVKGSSEGNDGTILVDIDIGDDRGGKNNADRVSVVDEDESKSELVVISAVGATSARTGENDDLAITRDGGHGGSSVGLPTHVGAIRRLNRLNGLLSERRARNSVLMEIASVSNSNRGQVGVGNRTREADDLLVHRSNILPDVLGVGTLLARTNTTGHGGKVVEGAAPLGADDSSLAVSGDNAGLTESNLETAKGFSSGVPLTISSLGVGVDSTSSDIRSKNNLTITSREGNSVAEIGGGADSELGKVDVGSLSDVGLHRSRDGSGDLGNSGGSGVGSSRSSRSSGGGGVGRSSDSRDTTASLDPASLGSKGSLLVGSDSLRSADTDIARVVANNSTTSADSATVLRSGVGASAEEGLATETAGSITTAESPRSPTTIAVDSGVDLVDGSSDLSSLRSTEEITIGTDVRDNLGLEEIDSILASERASLESIVLVVAVLLKTVKSTDVLLDNLAHLLVSDLGLSISASGNVDTSLSLGNSLLKGSEINHGQRLVHAHGVDLVDEVVRVVGETLEADKTLLVSRELGGDVGKNAERVRVVTGRRGDILITEETVNDREDIRDNRVSGLDVLGLSGLNSLSEGLDSGSGEINTKVNFSGGHHINFGLKERQEEALILNVRRSELRRESNGRTTIGEVTIELLHHIEGTLNGIDTLLEFTTLLITEASESLPCLDTNVLIVVKSGLRQTNDHIPVLGIPAKGHVLALHTCLEKGSNVLCLADILHCMKYDISTLVLALASVPLAITKLSLAKTGSNTSGKLLHKVMGGKIT